MTELTTLRLAETMPGERPRLAKKVTEAPTGYEGEGFPVRRAFAGLDYRDIDPFIHMDQMGEVEYAPMEPKGTNWHPHRGFETVTYMMDGTFLHQDSHGGGGEITNGGTQWMTAGSGILHIETPPEELVIKGGLFHGVQLWVNLPRTLKMTAPRYQNIEANKVTVAATSDGGGVLKLIAGNIDQHNGPGSTHTPITLAHLILQPGASTRIHWPKGQSSLAYILSGDGAAGDDRVPVTTGNMVLFEKTGDYLTLTANSKQDSRHTDGLSVLLLGGEPINEPTVAYGPFVMNTKAELIQAMDDYSSGKFGTIPPNALMPYRG